VPSRSEYRCSSESVEDAVDNVVTDADARAGDDRLAKPPAKEPLQPPASWRGLLVLRLVLGLVLRFVLRRLGVLGGRRVVRRCGRLGGSDVVVNQRVNRLQKFRGRALLVADR